LASPAVACGGPPQDALPEQVEVHREGVVLNAGRLVTSPMLPYVRMIVHLIEGVRLRGQELLRCLRETLRQHTIATGESGVYVLRFQHQHPP
jgi:hypothetical protein